MCQKPLRNGLLVKAKDLHNKKYVPLVKYGKR